MSFRWFTAVVAVPRMYRGGGDYMVAFVNLTCDDGRGGMCDGGLGFMFMLSSLV